MLARHIGRSLTGVRGRSKDRLLLLCWQSLEASQGLLFAHATIDAPTQRSSVNCKVGANSRGINEADWLGLTTFDGGKSRKATSADELLRLRL